MTCNNNPMANASSIPGIEFFKSSNKFCVSSSNGTPKTSLNGSSSSSFISFGFISKPYKLLKPFINVEGLDDDVTSFSNLSSDNKGGSSSSLAGGQGAEIDSLVKQWVGSETNDLEKAKKVHYGLRDYGIRYRKYYNTEYKTPENCLKHARDPGINCGDCAILTTACMLSAGLNA